VLTVGLPDATHAASECSQWFGSYKHHWAATYFFVNLTPGSPSKSASCVQRVAPYARAVANIRLSAIGNFSSALMLAASIAIGDVTSTMLACCILASLLEHSLEDLVDIDSRYNEVLSVLKSWRKEPGVAAVGKVLQPS
jgi:hypothetical protein